MAEWISVGTIVNGEVGGGRQEIGPGERFNPDTLGFSDEDVQRMEANGVIRRPRDDSVAAPADPGPPVPAAATAGDDDRLSASSKKTVEPMRNELDL